MGNQLSTPAVCSSGHALHCNVRTDGAHWHCDWCHTRYDPEDAGIACVDCDVDVCMRCVATGVSVAGACPQGHVVLSAPCITPSPCGCCAREQQPGAVASRCTRCNPVASGCKPMCAECTAAGYRHVAACVKSDRHSLVRGPRRGAWSCNACREPFPSGAEAISCHACPGGFDLCVRCADAGVTQRGVCAAGHVLTYGPRPEPWTCDGCDDVKDAWAPASGCASCELDLCGSCLAHGVRPLGTCPAGHRALSGPRAGPVACAGCAQTVSTGRHEPTVWCRKCHWELCERCAGGEAPASPVSAHHHPATPTAPAASTARPAVAATAFGAGATAAPSSDDVLADALDRAARHARDHQATLRDIEHAREALRAAEVNSTRKMLVGLQTLETSDRRVLELEAECAELVLAMARSGGDVAAQLKLQHEAALAAERRRFARLIEDQREEHAFAVAIADSRVEAAEETATMALARAENAEAALDQVRRDAADAAAATVRRATDALRRQLETEQELVADGACTVCCDAPRDTAFVPCGHRLCGGCSQKVVQCPMCRARVSTRLVLH